MNINAKITMSISRFFKKYGRIIIIVFAIWLIIFIINQQLKKLPKESDLQKTYNPNQAVVDLGGNVPKKYQSTINDTINNYFNYCNNKDYEKAYNMLTSDCKAYLYNNDLQEFQDYVDSVFTSKKTYNIQNYSNVNNVYIYNLTILDDIEATGTSGGYEKYVEKIALRMVSDEFLISNQGFIDSIDYNITTEDENIRLDVHSKDVSYQKEGYNVTIKNKTDKYIIIVDNSIKDEITLNLGDQKRKVTNYSNASLVLNPGETREEIFIFDKFYDDEKDPTEISLENVRIMDNYISVMENTSEIANRMYSFNISLKK